MPEIETSRLRLRLFTPDDLDDLERLFSDPEVMLYVGVEAGKILSREETKEILRDFIKGWQKHGFGRWAVIEKEIDQFIGLCGFKVFEGEAELIYALEKGYWRKGLATEAARAAVRYGFEEVKLERIVAVTRSENLASQSVMRSIGMKLEGKRSYHGIEGVGYAISREEFKAADSLYIVHRE